MRLMRVLLLLATATFAACGGDGPSSGRNVPPGSLQLYGVNGSQTMNAAVAFVAAPGSSTPNTQYVHISPSSEVYVTTSQTGEMFRYWMSGSTITITPAAPMETGTYTGTITVNGCYIPSGWPCNHVSDSPKSINVTYTVHGLSVTPAQLTFSSTGNAPTQSATLAVTGGSTSYSWQVTYSPSVADWLQVTPSGGTPDVSAGPVLFNVNAAGLPAGVYSAVVTFTTASSFSARMTVTLFVGDPSVNFIAPYVVPAAAAGDVVIRGRGFSALSPSGLSVQFNSTAARSASVVSDTEIRATYPPLAAGTYSVSVSSGATSIASRAALKLVVVDRPALPLTTIARPASAGLPESLIYDAERHALLFTDLANNRILRYSLADNGSTTLDVGPAAVGRLALSPDGTELIRIRSGQFQRLDPVTLAELSVANVPMSTSGAAFAFANDGGLIGSCSQNGRAHLCRYDMLTQAVTPVSLQSHMWYRHATGAADGSTLVLRYPSDAIDDTRVYTYDASTGRVSPRPGTAPSAAPPASVSRNGSRVILANILRTQSTAFFSQVNSTGTQPVVYDSQFNVVGTLPNEASTVVLSPDGNFAYAYFRAEGRVRKFNVSAAGAPEVGGGSAVAPANTPMSEMTISPDGGTLFLVGHTSVVIAPAP